MTDPKRWSEENGELGEGELRLLRAGLEPRVPRGAKRAVWVALAAQLPSAVAAATTAAAGTGAASALTGASLVKVAGIGLLLGATTMTAVTVVERHAAPSRTAEPSKALAIPSSQARTPSPAPIPVAPAPSAQSLAAPPAVASVAPASPERTRAPVDAAEPVRTAAPTLPAPSVATFPDETARSQHDAESRQVATARSLLRSGQPRAALLALEEARRDFPNGELSQEREALAIESLRVLGRSAEARRRAEAFLARYPASPHAALARKALQATP